MIGHGFITELRGSDAALGDAPVESKRHRSRVWRDSRIPGRGAETVDRDLCSAELDAYTSAFPVVLSRCFGEAPANPMLRRDAMPCGSPGCSYFLADPLTLVEQTLTTTRWTAEQEASVFRRLRMARQIQQTIPASRQSQLSTLVPIEASAPKDARHRRLELARLETRRIRQRVAEVYFKLAVSVARQFTQPHQEVDDLVGHACMTLMRAIDLFDERRGVRFSTYLTRALRTELSRFVLRERRAGCLSYDAHPSWPGRLSAPAASHPGEAAFGALQALLDCLDPREAQVIRSRFGLRQTPGEATLQALADELGISRERVRQVEQRALEKLRQLASEPRFAEALATLSS